MASELRNFVSKLLMASSSQSFSEDKYKIFYRLRQERELQRFKGRKKLTRGSMKRLKVEIFISPKKSFKVSCESFLF